MSFTIEPMRVADWPSVREFYRQGIATGNATFETSVPEWSAWDANHLKTGRLVARQGNGEAMGWVALSQNSRRQCYSGVAEVSIYVGEAHRGKGVGKALLKAVIAEADKAGFWTLYSSVFPENTASLALHQSCGFRIVGRREKLARLNGVWRDIMLLERRSKVVGV